MAEDEPPLMASPEALNFSSSSAKNSLVINTQPKKLRNKKKKKSVKLCDLEKRGYRVKRKWDFSNPF